MNKYFRINDDDDFIEQVGSSENRQKLIKKLSGHRIIIFIAMLLLIMTLIIGYIYTGVFFYNEVIPWFILSMAIYMIINIEIKFLKTVDKLISPYHELKK